MCTVSDKIQLCSCETKNVENLKHYWILKRPIEETLRVVGEMILPADIGEDANQLNEKIILKQLNDNNCFDVELQLNENDILELNFTLKDDQARSHNSLRFDGGYLVYAFKFKKGKWKKDNYNPFEIAFEEIYQGKIVRPFAKSKR